MLFLLFYLLPIIIIGCFVYWDMDHGQTLKDYVKVNEYEMPTIFTFLPALNLVVLVAAVGAVVWHFVSNFKKP